MEDPERDRYHPFRWIRGEFSALKSTNLRVAADVWNAARGDRFAPVWEATGLLRLPAALIPYVNVIDTGNGLPPFAYRYFGSGLADMHTFELTNKTTDWIEPEAFRNVCVDQYLMTIEAREPLVFLNDVPTKSEDMFRQHIMLRFPFSNDGRNVSQIMTVEESEGDPESTWELFRSAD